MLQNVAHEWHEFQEDPPGTRFESHYRRVRQDRYSAAALVRMGLGGVLALGGGVMLIAPGPGLIMVMFGLALLASESRRFARLLDRAELVVRRWARAAQLRRLDLRA